MSDQKGDSKVPSQSHLAANDQSDQKKDVEADAAGDFTLIYQWSKKGEGDDLSKFNPALEVEEKVFMRESIVAQTESGPVFSGQFTIKNNSQNYYGYIIKCNNHAGRVYKTNPRIDWIGPFKTAKISVKTLVPDYSHQLSTKDVLLVKGFRITRPVGKIVLLELFKRRSILPRPTSSIHTSFVKPVLLDEEEPKGAEGSELERITPVGSKFRIPNRIGGHKVNSMSQSMRSGQVQIQKVEQICKSLGGKSYIVYFIIIMAVAVWATYMWLGPTGLMDDKPNATVKLTGICDILNLLSWLVPEYMQVPGRVEIRWD